MLNFKFVLKLCGKSSGLLLSQNAISPCRYVRRSSGRLMKINGNSVCSSGLRRSRKVYYMDGKRYRCGTSYPYYFIDFVVFSIFIIFIDTDNTIAIYLKLECSNGVKSTVIIILQKIIHHKSKY